MSITLDDIDDSTAQWIREESRRRGLSVEALALELIREGIRIERVNSSPRTQDSLGALAGTWTKIQAEEFLNAIDDFEQADETLWQ